MRRRAFKASACLYLTASILTAPMMVQAKTPLKTVKTAKIHDSQLEEPVTRATPFPEQLQELKKALALEVALSTAEELSISEPFHHQDCGSPILYLPSQDNLSPSCGFLLGKPTRPVAKRRHF